MKDILTKDQSVHLMSLGIKFPYKVAVHNGEMAIGPCKDEYPDPNGWYIPISITDLLEILPKEIINRCDLQIGWNSPANEWFVGHEYSQYCHADELIDALYELCVWCIENGYLKLKKDEGKDS